MKSELTAEAVWELVKDVPGIDAEFRGVLRSTDLNPIATLCAWMFKQPPHWTTAALAIIVDAMKREMGEDYHGCDWDGSTSCWQCWVDGSRLAIGNTESEAIIAGYLAWNQTQ